MIPLTGIRLPPGMVSPAGLGTQAPGPGARPLAPADLQELSRPGAVRPSGPAGDSFAGVLGRVVGEVNAKQTAAGQAVHDLQTGQSTSLHQAMIAMEEASVSFQLMVEVRNKLLDAYQELMRMQV